MNPPKAERAKPSLSSDYNLLFKNKIGESSLDIHRKLGGKIDLDQTILSAFAEGEYFINEEWITTLGGRLHILSISLQKSSALRAA